MNYTNMIIKHKEERIFSKVFSASKFFIELQIRSECELNMHIYREREAEILTESFSILKNIYVEVCILCKFEKLLISETAFAKSAN
jgi:hypothetical protein